MEGFEIMQIHIEQIKGEGLTLEFEETADTFPVLTDMVDKGVCEFLIPIKTTLRALRIGDMVEIEGDINTSIRLTCGHCLKSFETSLKSRFSLTYRHREPGEKEKYSELKEFELKAEDMGLIYFRGEDINLQEEIQEQVVMAFPLSALCRRDCKGLCPKCGANLNDGDCSCDRTPPAGKFVVLKNLKLEKK